MYPLVSKTVLCGLFGFTRQAWYDNKKRQSGLQMQEVFILKQVKELRKEHKRMGAEKLHHLLGPVLQNIILNMEETSSMFCFGSMACWLGGESVAPKQPTQTIFFASILT